MNDKCRNKSLGAMLLTVAAAAGIAVLLARHRETSSAQSAIAAAPVEHDPSTPGKHVASGWSIAADPRQAVIEAAQKAQAALNGEPVSYLLVAPTVHYETAAVLDEVKRQFGDKAKIHGVTSSIGVMTEEGLHCGPNGALGLLAVAGEGGMRYGVAGVKLSAFATLEEAGSEAVRRAIRDASPAGSALPNIVLMTGTILHGDEEKVLQGIAAVIGEDIPVLGGNAGDEIQDGKWRQFTKDEVFKDGLVLTAVFADRKVGWAFESGFRVTDKEGIVTRSRGKTIFEIDNEPALDVYDRWLGGQLYETIKNRGLQDAPMFTSLHPPAKEIKGQQGQINYVISRIVPSQESLESKVLQLFVGIEQGSKIRLLSGNWQTMLNRAERAPHMAMIQGGIREGQAAFGVMFFCKLASRVVPESELPKLPLLTGGALGGAPFLGVITLGEQGPLPGFHAVNAHLAESIIVVGKP
ncbi:MAG: FIST signal transduction protein [Thermoguttaceae bacterium]